MENGAVFLFYNALNDFLSTTKKYSLISYRFNGTPSIKDAIEAIGIPHPEVDIILANGSPVDFSYTLRDNDKVDVYPLVTITNPSIHSITSPLAGPVCFIADVNTGKLAKAL